MEKRAIAVAGERVSKFLLETVAGEDRKPGIFGETRITGGEFAEIEDRAAIRFEAASVETLGAQTCGGGIYLSSAQMWHSSRIAQV